MPEPTCAEQRVLLAVRTSGLDTGQAGGEVTNGDLVWAVICSLVIASVVIAMFAAVACCRP